MIYNIGDTLFTVWEGKIHTFTVASFKCNPYKLTVRQTHQGGLSLVRSFDIQGRPCGSQEVGRTWYNTKQQAEAQLEREKKIEQVRSILCAKAHLLTDHTLDVIISEIKEV